MNYYELIAPHQERSSMSNRFHAWLIPFVTVVTSVCVGSFASYLREPTMPSGEQESQRTSGAVQETYIGSARCVTCHRKESAEWSNTQHALAFEHLPEKYREDASCLKCHVTAFGVPGGYDLGMEGDEAEAFLSVGCESCHGPGAAHEDAVKRWTVSEPQDEERLLKEIKTTIARTPTDSQCASCHVTQAHQQHPPYEGQPTPPTAGFHGGGRTTAANVVLPPSPHSYSVKTCGSCHYVQYKQWSGGKHFDLSARLPDQYGEDQECLKCHQKTLEPWDWYTAAPDSHENIKQLGVGCESCHGPALKHVLFTKKFIGGPQLGGGPKLGPELEAAARETIRAAKASVGGCVTCHVREAHLSHPEYDAPSINSPK